VVIDFAHTEQALEACLASLKKYTQGRLICVFGCGGDRDQSKRPRMAAVAEKLADIVIVTDDNPRHESAQKIMRDILAGFQYPDNARVIHDRQKAIEIAMTDALAEDLVVIAGKGHEDFQIIGNERLPFSDRYVVKQVYGGVLE
jgi:UDP-N-acetylmuramoyl-L-alanyl-D-glutamate--2,6-diaminopimelate ligase